MPGASSHQLDRRHISQLRPHHKPTVRIRQALDPEANLPDWLRQSLDNDDFGSY
jgi:hypothetical protein